MQINKFNISKALVAQMGDIHKLEDMTATVSKSPNIPSLLSDLVGMEDIFLTATNTYRHDYVQYDVTMPTEKAFHERGDNFDQRKNVDTKFFAVPSWGIQTSIRPEDLVAVRKPGTTDQLEMIEDLVNEDIAGMRNAFRLLDEVAIAHTITQGTLYTNGTVKQSDFYAEYAGLTAATRPTVFFDLGNTNVFPAEKGEEVRHRILDNMNDGQSASDFVGLAGKNFFTKYYQHPKTIQAMVDRAGIDAQDPLIKRLNDYVNGRAYRKFRGPDDILWVQYTATIGGARLIPDEEAYVMPVGLAGMFKRVFAPAQTMTYHNTTAEREYMWRTPVEEFSGVKMFMESNKGIYLQAPMSVIKCSSAAA